MLRSVVKRYAMGGIIVMGSLCQSWPTHAKSIYSGDSINYPVIVEGNILPSCSITEGITATNSSATIAMGRVDITAGVFPVVKAAQPIRLQGECLSTAGGWISVSSSNRAISSHGYSIFLNDLPPGEGVASGIGVRVGMSMSTGSSTTNVQPLVVDSRYAFPSDTSDTLELDFTAQLIPVNDGSPNFIITTGNFSSAITINLIIP